MSGATYLSVFAFAKAVKLSQSLSTQEIQSILPEIELLSPKGELIKLNENHHTSLPCTVALRVNDYFKSVRETELIQPNPFMSFQNARVTAKVIELSSYSKGLKAI
ncbi:transporter substrate-binding protein [Psychromonas sp. KJ10-10]|uniref:transporter substrate-binding protein n=1 Tax=Psychromonas sp. KJ10-10 TaxID=3391823 RepID=UPI0039B49CAF